MGNRSNHVWIIACKGDGNDTMVNWIEDDKLLAVYDSKEAVNIYDPEDIQNNIIPKETLLIILNEALANEVQNRQDASKLRQLLSPLMQMSSVKVWVHLGGGTSSVQRRKSFDWNSDIFAGGCLKNIKDWEAYSVGTMENDNWSTALLNECQPLVKKYFFNPYSR